MAHRTLEDVAVDGASGVPGRRSMSWSVSTSRSVSGSVAGSVSGLRSLLRRWRLRILVTVAVVLLLPVPWQHKADSGLGLAWGLDNRLVVEGQRLDPAGQYSWLTAGRPAVVGEVAWNRVAELFDAEAPTVIADLRSGPVTSRPVHVEPLAAAVGMVTAGVDVTMTEHVDAVIGGHGPPYSWIRTMSMGSSHGLMVGLVTYAAVSGEDLAAGRHVAGTGQLSADGSVGRIGGLTAKATGARRAGADVLLVPASQARELEGVDLGGIRVLGATSLKDAIQQLRATRDEGRRTKR